MVKEDYAPLTEFEFSTTNERVPPTNPLRVFGRVIRRFCACLVVILIIVTVLYWLNPHSPLLNSNQRDIIRNVNEYLLQIARVSSPGTSKSNPADFDSLGVPALTPQHLPIRILIQTSHRPDDPHATSLAMVLGATISALFPTNPHTVSHGEDRNLNTSHIALAPGSDPKQPLRVHCTILVDMQSYARFWGLLGTDAEAVEAKIANIQRFIDAAPSHVDFHILRSWSPSGLVRIWRAQSAPIYKSFGFGSCQADPRCRYLLFLEDDWVLVKERLFPNNISIHSILALMDSEEDMTVIRFNRFERNDNIGGPGDWPCMDCVKKRGLPVCKTQLFTNSPHITHVERFMRLFPNPLLTTEYSVSAKLRSIVFGKDPSRFVQRADGRCAMRGHASVLADLPWPGFYVWGRYLDTQQLFHLDARHFLTHTMHKQLDMIPAESSFLQCCVSEQGEVIWP